MVEEILNALCVAIKKKFTNNQIHLANVNQGFSQGDFVITVEKTKIEPVPANLYRYSVTFLLQKHSDEYMDLYNSVPNLFEAVELIDLGDNTKLKAVDQKCEIASGVLNFAVEYYFYGKIEDNKQFMEDLFYEQK